MQIRTQSSVKIKTWNNFPILYTCVLLRTKILQKNAMLKWSALLCQHLHTKSATAQNPCKNSLNFFSRFKIKSLATFELNSNFVTSLLLTVTTVQQLHYPNIAQPFGPMRSNLWAMGYMVIKVRINVCKDILSDDQVGLITDLYYLIQIPYRLFKSYVHHVATVNIPPKMAASSEISVKRCW